MLVTVKLSVIGEDEAEVFGLTGGGLSLKESSSWTEDDLDPETEFTLEGLDNEATGDSVVEAVLLWIAGRMDVNLIGRRYHAVPVELCDEVEPILAEAWRRASDAGEHRDAFSVRRLAETLGCDVDAGLSPAERLVRSINEDYPHLVATVDDSGEGVVVRGQDYGSSVEVTGEVTE